MQASKRGKQEGAMEIHGKNTKNTSVKLGASELRGFEFSGAEYQKKSMGSFTRAYNYIKHEVYPLRKRHKPKTID